MERAKDEKKQTQYCHFQNALKPKLGVWQRWKRAVWKATKAEDHGASTEDGWLDNCKRKLWKSQWWKIVNVRNKIYILTRLSFAMRWNISWVCEISELALLRECAEEKESGSASRRSRLMHDLSPANFLPLQITTRKFCVRCGVVGINLRIEWRHLQIAQKCWVSGEWGLQWLWYGI